MNRFKCVVFDFDGTLADTNAGIIATFQETFRRLGLDVPTAETLTSYIGLTLYDIFGDLCPGYDESQIRNAVLTYQELFPSTAYHLITGFPGIVDVVREIHDRGLLLAVATSRSHKSLEYLAEQIGVLPYFKAMYALEDVEHHKPAPDMVLKVLEKFSLSPDEVLVVGDASYDILMGHAAGCKACGVTWGNQSRESLSTAEPEYIVDRPEELLSLV